MLSESRELVASSRINILGFLIKALAIAILCLYPPLSSSPFGPTLVLNPSGNLSLSKTNSETPEALHTSIKDL